MAAQRLLRHFVLACSLLLALILMLPAPARAAAAEDAEIVQQYYLAYYGRPADRAGLDYWLGNIGQAASEQERAALLDAVRASFGSALQPEFVAIYGSDANAEDFFQRAYRNLLNRSESSSDAIDYWLGVLERFRNHHLGTADSAATADARARADLLSLLINAALDNPASDDYRTFANKLQGATLATEALNGLPGGLHGPLLVAVSEFLNEPGLASLSAEAVGEHIAQIRARLLNGEAGEPGDDGAGEGRPQTVQLAVSTFGRGEVIFPAIPALACPEGDCEHSFAPGSMVTLRPRPADGWKLAHWNGCDFVEGSLCHVELDRDHTVYPSFVRDTELQLADNVILLDRELEDALRSSSGDSLVFATDIVDLNAIAVGTILVSTRDEGFARRVIDRSRFGSSLIVTTVPASLEEIIADGSFSFSADLTPEDIAEARLAPGVRLLRDRADSGDSGKFVLSYEHVLHDEDGNPATVFDQVRISGKATIRLRPEVSLDVGLLDGIREFRSVMHTSEQVEFELAAGGDIIKPVSSEKLFSLAWLRFHPILVGPVVIVPTVKGYVNAKGELKVEITSGMSMQWDNSGGVHYRQGQGWRGVHSSDFKPSYRPLDITGKARIEAGLGTYAQLSIYGVAGPFTQVGPYAFIEGSAKAGFNNPECLSWELSSGGRIKAGAEGKILGWGLAKYEATVFDRRWRLAEGKTAACDPDTVAPSTPEAPWVSTLDAGSLRLDYAAATDNVAVSHYEIHRARNAGEPVFHRSTSELSFIDTEQLEADTSYCYRLVAVDAANNRSRPGPTSCGRTAAHEAAPPLAAPAGLSATANSANSIQLDWLPSSAPHGYLILRDGYPIDHSDRNSLLVTDLIADEEYCFTVIALDDDGNMSAPSLPACAETAALELASWRMRFGCVDREYNFEQRFDLDFNRGGEANLAFDGRDYNGQAMFIKLGLSLSPVDQQIDGRVDFTFESGSTRLDTFSTVLDTDDTGDLPTIKVDGGCEAVVRFDRLQP